MSAKTLSPPPLMELDVIPPKGYPKLPRWDPILKYRLKDPSLINAFENPFHISSDLSDTEDSNIDFSKFKHLLGFLPKSAPSPHTAEEPIEKSKFSSKSQAKFSGRRVLADRVFPIKYKAMAESIESNDSTNSSTSSESSLSFVDKYLKLKRTKALLLQKMRGDSDTSMVSSIKLEDPELLNETDFFLEENVIKRENEFTSSFPEAKSNIVKETSFLFNGKSKSSPKKSKSFPKRSNSSPNNSKSSPANSKSNITNHCPPSSIKNNRISKNCILNSLAKQMNECYI